ncbi:MAG: hypothetical protein FJX53_13415 [Alphaproteobacteria bacterium]|nr:hypothetical protein [Alphaproteobacteria bacterium]
MSRRLEASTRRAAAANVVGSANVAEAAHIAPAIVSSERARLLPGWETRVGFGQGLDELIDIALAGERTAAGAAPAR